METFDLNINGFTYKDCVIEGTHYTNPKNNAIRICNKDGLIAIASVNLEYDLCDDEIAIKNWTENKGMDDELKRIGIIDELIETVPSGFVMIPIYHLTDKGKKLFKKYT
jgi:hypothetical protein